MIWYVTIRVQVHYKYNINGMLMLKTVVTQQYILSKAKARAMKQNESETFVVKEQKLINRMTI